MWYYRQQKAQVQLNTGLASKRLNQELLGLSELHGGTISMVYYRSLERNNQKPFWRYIYSQGNDRAGVAPLKDGGELFSGSKDKAEILNTVLISLYCWLSRFVCSANRSQCPNHRQFHHKCCSGTEIIIKDKPQQSGRPGWHAMPCPKGAFPRASPSIISYLHTISYQWLSPITVAYC